MKGKKFLTLSLTVAMLAGSALSVSAAGVADVFDANYYASKYSDLQAAFGNDANALLKHFVTSGAKEGRVMSPVLDVAAYRAAYKDLDAAFGDNWDAYVDHYLMFGVKEGRTEGVLFDLADYANKNADVKAAYGDDYVAIAKHYVNYGIKEGRPGGQIVKKAAAATSTSPGSSSSSNSNASSGNSGTTTSAKPSIPSIVAYGHDHNWAEMIATGNVEVIEFELATCQKTGYINYRCPEQVTSIWYTDGSVEWMLTREVPTADGKLAKGVPFHGKVVDDSNVSQCSATTGRLESDKLHHKVPDEGAYIVDHPTCVDAGVARYVCETCGEFVSAEPIPALGHVFPENPNKVITAVSCTEDGRGFKVFICQRCGYEDIRDPYYKHSVAAYKITKDPKCTTEGEEAGICSICGKTDTRKIEMAPHNTRGNVTISVDTNIGGELAHAYYDIVYCDACNRISDVSANVDTLNRVLCKDTNGDGYCNACGRRMDRAKITINSEKLYNVGDFFNNIVVQ